MICREMQNRSNMCQWSCAINYIGHKTPARSVFTGVLVVFAMMAIMVRQCNGADTRNTNDLTDKYVSHPQCNKNITKHSIIVEEENKYITPSEMEVDWDISYHIIRHSIQHFICFKHCLFISSRVSAAYGLIHVGSLFVFCYAALHGLLWARFNVEISICTHSHYTGVSAALYVFDILFAIRWKWT